MFYERLQNIMDKKEMNIPEVARVTGLPDSTIRSIITRKSKTAALEVASKIAKGLNVSLEYLNSETEVMEADNSLLHIKKAAAQNEQPPDEETMKLLRMIDDLDRDGIIKTLEYVELLKLKQKKL